MRRIALILLALLLAGSMPVFGAETPQSPAVQATGHVSPIHTPAQLDHYIKTTPASESPLSLLPVGARTRFLRTLVWGETGLGSFDLADLQRYLTDAQAAEVLALFGAEDFAKGLGGRAKPLTAAERNAPETPLERKFDELYFARADATYGTGKPMAVSDVYDRQLASYQRTSALARLGDSDMDLLFRATQAAAFASHEPGHLDDLRLDLAELHRRGLATPAQVSQVHDQLVAARRFEDANALAQHYPTAGIAPLPTLHQAPGVDDGNPTVLMVEPDGKSMLRKAVDLDTSLRIVVVAGCHYSVDAARAIHADPQLDKLFSKHGIWLAGETESLADVLVWNREFPDQPMNVAWRTSEWPMLDSWDIPTFYVFRNGKLIDQWAGWPADTGMHTLREHLEKNGLLR